MDAFPEITPRPTRHPQSCASISSPLLALLDTVLSPPPNLTLSVGSGPGLLEAALLRRHPSRAGITSRSLVSFLGIEVSTPEGTPPVNRFLPEPNTATVPGTWAIAGEVGKAQGLVFVYPRQSGLIKRYLEAGTRVCVVVWIGPRCDAEEMTGPLRAWGAAVPCNQELLVEEGEAMAVFRKA